MGVHRETKKHTNFRVVATAIGSPDLRNRLNFDESTWNGFFIYELNDFDKGSKVELVDAVAKQFSISLEESAKSLLVRKSDGTPSGLILPLMAFRNKQLSKTEVEEFQCTYPLDWTLIRKRYFENNRYRVALMNALSILQEAAVNPVTSTNTRISGTSTSRAV